MQSLGHPILGDPLYACPVSKTKADRLLLHAEHLAFAHPITGKPLHFTCAPDF